MWFALPIVTLLCILAMVLNGCGGGAEWLDQGDVQEGAEFDRRAEQPPPLPLDAIPPPAETIPPSHHQTVCLCSSEYDPVCGSNEITYNNVCLANCEKTRYHPFPISWEPGVCAPPTNQRAAGFRGCFKDNPNRAFAGGSVRVGQSLDTFVNCQTRCHESGSKFMALQHGDECYCGNDFQTGDGFDQVADYECRLMADLCEVQFGCGNAWRNSVWEMSALTATTATTTYFLSEVGQSCTQACQGGLCDLRAVVHAGVTNENCNLIIGSMATALQLPPVQDGGSSNDDNTGCTYHPLAGQGWSQVLVKDAMPT